VFFALVGVIELVDFAGQVSTLANVDQITNAARALDIGVDAVRTRISLLVPLAAITSAVALNVAYGAVVGDARVEGRIICSGLLLLHAVAFVVSGLVVNAREFALGGLFLVLGLVAMVFVRVEPSTVMAVSE
jgi:hypothetical protein